MSKRNRTRFAELDRARGRRLIQEARMARAKSEATSDMDSSPDAAERAANDDLGPRRAAG